MGRLGCYIGGEIFLIGARAAADAVWGRESALFSDCVTLVGIWDVLLRYWCGE